MTTAIKFTKPNAAPSKDPKDPNSAKAADGIIAQGLTEDFSQVRRKADWILLPLLGFCYFLQFLDKQTLSYASLLGMISDNHLQGSQFSWTASIFYFGYIFWSYPTMFLSVRLPIGKYLGATVIAWAAVLMCHAACHNFTSLMITRFVLGAFEAAVAPGFSLVTGMWYTRREQPFRYGLWFLGNGMASLLGGLLAYAIGHIDSGFAAWRYLFLIFGAVTAVWGCVMLLLLPDTPSSALWLSSTEREMAVHRLVADGQAGVKGTFRVSQVIEALRDPTTWFLSLYTFSVNIANGGLTAFGSLVIQGFGYQGLDALLIQMPAGAAQLGFVILSSALCSWIPNTRTITMVVLTLISLTGMILMYAVDASDQAGRMAGFCLSLAFAANMPLGLSLVTSNVQGFTKRAVVNACVLVMYCAGNIVGPQFFSVAEAPRYSKGITASLAGLGLGVFWVLCLRVYLQWQNRIRSKENESSEHREMPLMEDLTDWEIPGCQYVL